VVISVLGMLAAGGASASAAEPEPAAGPPPAAEPEAAAGIQSAAEPQPPAEAQPAAGRGTTYRDPDGLPPPPAPYMPPPPPFSPMYGPGPYWRQPGAFESTSRFHTHDGFYLHVDVGGGGGSISSTQAGVKTTESGGVVTFGGAMGGVIARNLVLYGALFSTVMSDPTVKSGGTEVTSRVSAVQMSGIGPGVAYYFERINLYLALTLAMQRVIANDSNGNRLMTSRTGGAGQLVVGKEWWVSHEWGFGVAGQLTGGSVKDRDVPNLTWATGALTLVFSATYN
jgi:hypothetical protein